MNGFLLVCFLRTIFLMGQYISYSDNFKQKKPLSLAALGNVFEGKLSYFFDLNCHRAFGSHFYLE